MESTSVSEEVATEAVDTELPDMVPVSIRMPHAGFVATPLHNVLAGVLLTWEEFLHLFDISPDPNEFFIRGNNGIKYDLSQKIGDYVDSFQRKLRIYNVTLEKTNGLSNSADATTVSEIGSTTATPPPDDQTQVPNIGIIETQEQVLGKGEDKFSSLYMHDIKKPKLLDADKERKYQKKAKHLLQEMAQDGLHTQINSLETPVVTSSSGTKRTKLVKKVNTTNRKSLDSRSPTPTSMEVDGAGYLGSRRVSAGSKLKRLDGTSRDRKSKDSLTSANSSSSKKVKPIMETRQSMEVKLRSRSSRSTKESESTDESAESDIDVVPPKNKKKLLKESVLKYLTKNVSPRSFMRLRNELMALRQQEKYFKVTSVVPMTAGMMEQTLCRMY